MIPAGGIKRFYKTVGVAETDGGWQVTLDDRPVKAPSGAPMVLASRVLAAEIAAEWQAQGERVAPDTMPLYRLIATAVDRVGPRRDEVAQVSLKFAETDLLCYRAEASSALGAEQDARWQPVLDWAHETLGAQLRVTEGIVPVNQPAAALAALERAIADLDDLRLTAISSAAAAMGSLVLAFALAHRHIDAAEAAELALLDEIFQTRQWGEDTEAERRRARVRAEISDTARFLDLLG